ncbi:hypothetical protein TrST_g7925 [Triparma strigata]|uniref:Uncharacterized protein n=1 Tax=Triparma strigata TaxID=1606541 RepID=A0A9W7EV70_9STRA|nr:hypothetical protein TrST_g7925 [Triparma strigata]
MHLSSSPRGRSPRGDRQTRSTLNEYTRRNSPTRRGRSKGSPGRGSPRSSPQRNLPGDYMSRTPGAIPPQIAYTSPDPDSEPKLSNTRRLRPMSNDQSQKAMQVLEREFGKVFNEAMTTLNEQKSKVNKKIKENGLHDRHLLAKKEDKRRYATFDWHQHALQITMERNQLQQTILAQQRDYDKLFGSVFETTASVIRSSVSRCQKKAMFCVESFLDRIEEANNALVHADEVEELCNERVQVMEAEFWKKTEIFQSKTTAKNEKVVEELQKQIKDAHAAIEAERYASELRAMDSKRFEADQRVEKEAAVRERYEGIIQNLASENAVIRRELNKEIEKSHTLTNSLMIEFEKRCRNFEKNLIETLLQERDGASPALHQKLQEHLKVVSDASSYGESNPGQQIGEIVATYHDKVYSDLKFAMSGRRPQTHAQHQTHHNTYAESDISWNGSADPLYENNGSHFYHDDYSRGEDYSVDIDANAYLYNGPEPPPPLTEKEKELQREVQLAKMKLKAKEDEVRAKTQKAEERIMKRDMMIYNLERKVKGEEGKGIYPRYAPPPPPSYKRIEQLKQEEERKKQQQEIAEREKWEAERKMLEERQRKKEKDLVQVSSRQDSVLDEQRRKHHKQLQERRQNRMINRNTPPSNSASPSRLERSQMELDLERQKGDLEQQTRQLEARQQRSPVAPPKSKSELELQREAQLARIERLERRQQEEEQLDRLRDQTEARQLKRAELMMSSSNKSESDLLKEQIAQSEHLRQMIVPTQHENLLPSPTEKQRVEAEIARQNEIAVERQADIGRQMEMAASYALEDDQRDRAMSPNRGRPVYQQPISRQQSPRRRPPATPPTAAQARQEQEQAQAQQYGGELQGLQKENEAAKALEDQLEAQRIALEKANEAGRIEGEKMRQTKAGRRAQEKAEKEAKEKRKQEQAKKHAENEALRRRRYTQVLSPEEQKERVKRAQEIRFEEEKVKQEKKAKEKADKDAALAARKQREKAAREVEEKKRQQEDLKKAKKLIAEQKEKKEEEAKLAAAKEAADMATL